MILNLRFSAYKLFKPHNFIECLWKNEDVNFNRFCAKIFFLLNYQGYI